MYETAFARPPTDRELADAMRFLHEQARDQGLSPDAAVADPRVWADLAHVLVNVKEFIFLN